MNTSFWWIHWNGITDSNQNAVRPMMSIHRQLSSSAPASRASPRGSAAASPGSGPTSARATTAPARPIGTVLVTAWPKARASANRG